MLYLSLLTAAILMILSPSPAFAEEACSQEKVQAIGEYFRANPVEEVMEQTLAEYLKNVPERERALFAEIWKEVINVGELKRVMANLMCKHFTREEIEALAAFYGSPAGKSVMRKMPQYAGEFLPYQMEIMKKTIAKIIEILQRRQQEIEKKPKES